MREPPSIESLRLPYYDGAGNDFFLYDERALGAYPAYSKLARTVSDRRGPFGGADGLLIIGDSDDAVCDVRMRVFNADGSEPEMCGNGARCAVRYLLEDGGEQITLQTSAGPIRGVLLSREEPFAIGIDLGEPRFLASDLGVLPTELPEETPMLDIPISLAGEIYRFDGISFGNPHIVLFVADVEMIDVAELGLRLGHAPLFARGTNVHFAQVLDEGTMRVRHWERGAGVTQACGTGAAAVAVAASRRGLVNPLVRVLVPGGTLQVFWNGGRAEVSGPVNRHPGTSEW
jgi:diaminopimelate epimerase